MGKVGQVLQAKSGKFYLKAEKPITLAEDEVLFFSTPQDDIESLVSRGIINREEADVKLAKIPQFVRYNVSANTSKQ